MKDSRSGLNMANLQELLDAEDSAKWALLGKQNQYASPEWLAKKLAAQLDTYSINSVLDPQCAGGNLLMPFNYAGKFGIDIDKRGEEHTRVNFIRSNCVDSFNMIDEIMPELRFDAIVANPPFAKRWTWRDKVMDSSLWTWEQSLIHGNSGIFISNDNTCKKLGIDHHPYIVSYETHAGVWEQCDVIVGCAVWKNPEPPEATSQWEITDLWNKLKQIVDEEQTKRPPFNVWITQAGKLETYLSTRAKMKNKLTDQEILRLHTVKGSHPLALTVEKETRKLLRHLCECGVYTIQPEARKAIEDALSEVNKLACPIMPVTDFQRVAYCDEEDTLICQKSELGFTACKKYELNTASYSFIETFTRNKVHFDEETGEMENQTHECSLTGQDRYIELINDEGINHRFQDRPRKDVPNEHEESLLWQIFTKPTVNTTAEVNACEVESNKHVLRTCEMIAGYKYYPGQVEYLARLACKDNGLIAAGVGIGKTLFAISLIAMKAPQRTLLIAPQGTMRSSENNEDDDEMEYQASQWLSELERFAPYLQIFQLFSMDDYHRILGANGGELPAGVYVTYYQAAFHNGARESCPPSWDDERLEKELQRLLGTKHRLPETIDGDPRGHCETLGMEKNGIRCIVEPCMTSQIGHLFDCVLVDEVHYAVNSTATTTQMLIRMQPKYRYGFTATPMPNLASQLFYLMGWLCVPDWYKGDIRNAAWPYSRGELGRFENTFLSKERDFTQERINKRNNPDWKGKCEKSSPVISAPARLLKLISPTLAFISKEAVNPDYKPAKLVDVRVPMGREQAGLYAHFLDRSNIPCRHPLIRARKQIAYLRAICADPRGFEHGGPSVMSNFNPKTVAILELIAKIMQEGEQVVVVSARVGLTNELAMRMSDAGIPFSRIDSTVSPDQHSHQSNLFKAGKTRVHFMGIKCAVGHSYPECPYMIIGSLEYSWGSLDQARGRVDRVNSTKDRTIYCILNKTSIEELIFDICGVKGDAATICLRGQRVARDFKPVDMGEVLSDAITQFSDASAQSEADLERNWKDIRKKLRVA